MQFRHGMKGTFAISLFAAFLSGIPAGVAQDADARVVIPDVPDGAKVDGCYSSIGVIYGKYKFDFCLKRKSTYHVSGDGLDCRGRLDWDTEGPGINIRLRRTSCGDDKAWSADTAWCRPNLLLGLINLITESGHLSGLTCDYRPATGTGADPIIFGAKRVDD
jgi:hypothetical protein